MRQTDNDLPAIERVENVQYTCFDRQTQPSRNVALETVELLDVSQDRWNVDGTVFGKTCCFVNVVLDNFPNVNVAYLKSIFNQSRNDQQFR